MDHPVKELFHLRRQIKDLQQAEKELAEQIADSLGGEGRYVLSDLIVFANRTTRFDAATAARVLSPEKLKKILVERPDASRAKEILSPEDYNKCKREYGMSLTIKEVTDE